MSNKLPSYLCVYNQLKEEILNGKYKIGEMLPIESELEKIFNVSRITIRKAVKMLNQDKLVHVKQGCGTIVLDYKATQNLNHVVSVTETLRQKGYAVRTKSMHIDVILAPPEIASCLKIAIGDKVARFQRIQLADEKPIVIMKNYVPEHLVVGVSEYCNKFLALYQFLEDTYQIKIDGASDRIFAKNASFEEAQMLEIETGEALLCIQRTCLFEGNPVCLDDVVIIGKHYELTTNMNGRYRGD
ncbi:GntR family transcriptional regulator [Lachnotalea glycerini]|uniref:GntR family transcriptional regulator n=1 Tax=Lachnotalea glycerini TaxID=1763509 RepID=A0A255IRW7_9FIRM|nr:GntR family transcriptional regulator [Lachnotalea glycerini]PXV86310.1 GntR family transcriptional regulator [Lachnotalea glycerini]RDY30401.1 GntR family transcriptional regulator [Lachnotalea glycerini]